MFSGGRLGTELAQKQTAEEVGTGITASVEDKTMRANQLLLTYLLKDREDRTVPLKDEFIEDFEGTDKHYTILRDLRCLVLYCPKQTSL
jgi:hypothetical protein